MQEKLQAPGISILSSRSPRKIILDVGCDWAVLLELIVETRQAAEIIGIEQAASAADRAKALERGIVQCQEAVANLAFKNVGLNFEDYVVQGPGFMRSSDIDVLISDPSKARQ